MSAPGAADAPAGTRALHAWSSSLSPPHVGVAHALGGGGAVPNASGRPPGLCCSSPIKHPMFRLWPGPLWTQAVYQALARTSFIPASLTHRCPRRRPRSKPFQVRTLMQVPSGHAPAMQGQEGPGSPHSRDRQVPSLQPGPSALSPVPLSVSLLSRRLGATAESALQKDL